MNIIRYLSFELNKTCNLSEAHRGQCPINHPERYLFGRKHDPITDSDVVLFWRWCRSIGFRGIVLWHMYNEPTFVLGRIRNLMDCMKREDPFQPFQLTTNTSPDVRGFDIVHFSDYDGGDVLDKRILTNTGEGKPYSEMPRQGLCARGRGWEILIDHYGNWCLCCNDWRCEEALGNIKVDPYDEIKQRWDDKRYKIAWRDEESYNALPRMCRACMDKNPSLQKRGGI